MPRTAWLLLATLLFLTAFLPAAAFAEVKLRVEARPIADPINVFVTVTNGGGNPVVGLTDQDFQVLVDGNPVPLSAANFDVAPIDDAMRQVSIIFVMDYSGSVDDVQADVEASVVEFLNTMNLGDWSGIIKFNESLGAQILPPGFLEIADENIRQDLIDAVESAYPGTGSPVYAAVKLAVEEFESASVQTGLPEGPKAIVLVSDGRNNDPSVTGPETVTLANDQQLSIFTVAVGEINFAAMTELAFQTGGQFYEAQDGQAVEDAYTAISNLLQNEYVLTFQSDITDCEVHTAQVRVTNFEPAQSTFTRCTAPGSSTPPPEGDVGGTPPPPPADDTGGGGGGGGGALGLLPLIAALSLVLLRRRRQLA